MKSCDEGCDVIELFVLLESDDCFEGWGAWQGLIRCKHEEAGHYSKMVDDRRKSKVSN
jgi:hypothetical protein